MIAQDSLSTAILQSISYRFTLDEGQINGEGAEFLRRETANAQFTLVGDYPDSKNISDFTAALIPLLDRATYKALALGVGVPSGRFLDTLANEPKTVLPQLKVLNTRYAFTENETIITPMPDMKSVEDAQFVQRAAEQDWSIVGFGYESWNALPLLVDAMYKGMPAELRDRQKNLYMNCLALLNRFYSNRNGDLLAFSDAVEQSTVVQQFLQTSARIPQNTVLVSAFKAGVQRARMYAKRNFFEKNQLRIKDEKHFLKQELERIGFDIHNDKLLIKWDRNFLSRGFQPYAFYGIGNMLSEIANYNGTTSLHIAMIPRYNDQTGELLDALSIESRSSNPMMALLGLGRQDEWTIIDLRPMVQGFYYTPVKYLLNPVEEDLIKRFDLLIIPPTERAVELLID